LSDCVNMGSHQNDKLAACRTWPAGEETLIGTGIELINYALRVQVCRESPKKGPGRCLIGEWARASVHHALVAQS
jgi:hypothetical protein